jgi:cytidylate kinase
VLPDADVKIYVTASAAVRARRRTEELRAKGRMVDYHRILSEIAARDARDSGRSVAPLAAAPDAHVIDTTDLDREAVFRKAVAIVEACRQAKTDSGHAGRPGRAVV